MEKLKEILDKIKLSKKKNQYKKVLNSFHHNGWVIIVNCIHSTLEVTAYCEGDSIESASWKSFRLDSPIERIEEYLNDRTKNALKNSSPKTCRSKRLLLS